MNTCTILPDIDNIDYRSCSKSTSCCFYNKKTNESFFLKQKKLIEKSTNKKVYIIEGDQGSKLLYEIVKVDDKIKGIEKIQPIKIFLGCSWISHLPDTLSINDLSIPGTHNSGALYEPLSKTATCQKMTIEEQLEAGVRFFDIRCRHKDGKFSIYHGRVFQKQSYDEIENVMQNFLKKYNKEFLIVTIKEENSPIRTSKPFDETVQQYIENSGGLYFTKNYIPQLQEVRGKIVLLRRFSTQKELGIDATDWEHTGYFKSKKLFIQDCFNLPNASTKWSLVRNALDQTKRRDDKKILHLNFMSGYVKSRLGLPNIKAISDVINPKLMQFLERSKQRRLGCLITDFMTAELSESIYLHNFIC